ncbi:MAG: hypothetical protein RBR41_08765 [Desulfovibrio sp.]|uniref:hypothetical protein n=1 Tax=Desulfovibrio sp. TaxID=885 RepID=UPI002A365033|nr:hypothetical protein [Desulfovibrio sp.]MDY0259739.1 hypothetical protein [Desulfovibrio sp.]
MRDNTKRNNAMRNNTMRNNIMRDNTMRDNIMRTWGGQPASPHGGGTDARSFCA